MSDKGFAYIPEECEVFDCPVHFALHGCRMNNNQIGMDFIVHSQFNEIAEANKIVIIYPQVGDVQVTPTYKTGGCWDLVGYSDWDSTQFMWYMTKNGEQPKFLYNLYQSLVQGKVEFTPISLTEFSEEAI